MAAGGLISVYSASHLNLQKLDFRFAIIVGIPPSPFQNH